ncbi:hypothetical protein GWK47_026612 [Chionoecetes opilio]|uniref:Uncharacterized protein n=1 Tax=Chionoecetes opilio TaxID=41210 RepID=A0A8J8WNH8_CHIOP|nr:hypothetical protein GWK47_026612 [Chionoecetes opilio]
MLLTSCSVRDERRIPAGEDWKVQGRLPSSGVPVPRARLVKATNHHNDITKSLQRLWLQGDKSRNKRINRAQVRAAGGHSQGGGCRGLWGGRQRPRVLQLRITNCLTLSPCCLRPQRRLRFPAAATVALGLSRVSPCSSTCPGTRHEAPAAGASTTQFLPRSVAFTRLTCGCLTTPR